MCFYVYANFPVCACVCILTGECAHVKFGLTFLCDVQEVCLPLQKIAGTKRTDGNCRVRSAIGYHFHKMRKRAKSVSKGFQNIFVKLYLPCSARKLGYNESWLHCYTCRSIILGHPMPDPKRIIHGNLMATRGDLSLALVCVCVMRRS